MDKTHPLPVDRQRSCAWWSRQHLLLYSMLAIEGSVDAIHCFDREVLATGGAHEFRHFRWK